MKIVEFRAENFKKLKVVEIKPNGDLVTITGANEAGKSTVLDAIFAAVGGGKHLPSRPIRKGEQHAHVKLDLGEIVVTRKFTAAGSTLTVEGANGARFNKPQQMLDDLIGSIAFDPMEFARMKPDEQFETLRGLVKLDVDLDALAGQNKTDFETRTGVNRDAKALRAQAAGITVALDLPADPVDTAALLRAMQEAGETNADIERRKARREAAEADADRLEQSATEHTSCATALRLQADQADRDAAADVEAAEGLRKKLAEAGPLPEPVDASKVRADIEAANATNSKIASRDRRREFEKQAETKEAEALRLTDAMEARDTARKQAVQAAKMPIDGLAFGDGEVLYQDLPLDQASQAARIRISMAVAMALNPKLRVLTIKDGSLIDDAGMQVIATMAKANDFQCWIEKVSTDAGVGILIEDGAVANPGAEQTAMPLDAA
jgi:hypothetical protein